MRATTGLGSGVMRLAGIGTQAGWSVFSPRLPSDWLSLDKSVFQLVAQTMGARREPESRESLPEPRSPAPPSKPPWYDQGNRVLGSQTGFF